MDIRTPEGRELIEEEDMNKDGGQRKDSANSLSLSGEKKSNSVTDMFEDHGCWEGQGSLPAAQPELGASSGGTEGSVHPLLLLLLLGLLNSF